MEHKTDARILEILEIICENVGPDWEELATSLGLSQPEIKVIKRNTDASIPPEQCWAAICKWRERTPRNKLLPEITFALNCCRQKRISDIVQKLLKSSDSVNAILAPHVDREEKMLEAMYTIVDHEPSHWRNILKHLGLNDKDIIGLEKQFGNRTREKCMHGLYKWRHMVPLQKYKLSSLVMALRASKLQHLAEIVKNTGSVPMSYHTRKHHSDEIIITLEVKKVNVEKYTPTPSSTPRGDLTPRPKNSLPPELLNSYILNKIIFHLLDELEDQKYGRAHPLVTYLHMNCCGSEISEVDRKTSYISIKNQNKQGLDSVKESVKNGELNTVLTDSLLTETMKQEIGLADAQICGVLH